MKLVKRLELLGNTLETEIKLAPCPFCGEKFELKLCEHPRDYYIQCLTCTTTGPNGVDAECSVIQWNRREDG